jgi:LDH2 family malate/lactate/ureidoglycolate dehydrogenase
MAAHGRYPVYPVKRINSVDRILLPGEMEFNNILERREHGISLAPTVVEKLRQLTDNLKLPDRLD